MKDFVPPHAPDMRLLSDEQLRCFRQDGYLVLKDFVSTQSCDQLRAHALELVDNFEPGTARSIFTTSPKTRAADDYFLDSSDKIHFFFEEEAFSDDGLAKRGKALSINKIGHALHDLDPHFDRFSRTQKLATLVAELGIDHPRLVQSMYIFKQPFIGGEVSCHQDATFLHTNPERMIGLWFALEDAHQNNGCLWAIPGGHRLGLKSRFIRKDRSTHMDVFDTTTWNHADLVPLEVSKGALIVLDGCVPHMSHANRSDHSRHAYTLHVISGSSEYPASNWLQRPQDMPLRGF